MTPIRFTQLSEVLARRIAQEHYPVGSMMPTEKELMDEFDTSRHTVRAALRQLQDAGLVSRRRGSGTVVEARTASGGFSQPLTTLEDLVHLAAKTPRHLRASRAVVADVDLARVLGVPPGTRWIRFTSTRHGDDGNPIVWTDVYLDAQYSDVRKAVEESPDRLISALIEEKYGRCIVSVGQDISACALPAAIAKVLRVEPNSPGLFILRQYRDAAKELVSVSTSYHPAGRYKFSTTLVRAG
jgi:GntR family transcriptional regulator